MNHEVKYELDRLKEMVKSEKTATDKIHIFFNEAYYEDDYSGNEIFEMQDEFLHYAKKYLKENHSGKYVIQHGNYAILIATKKYFDSMEWKMGWTIC